jgi:hypothetical protein
MRSSYLRQLILQDWECCYCGGPFTEGQETAKAYDNSGYVHLSCVFTGVIPAPEWATEEEYHEHFEHEVAA